LPADLTDAFFIKFSVAPARVPRADDTNIVAPFCMHHNQQFVQMGTAWERWRPAGKLI
jgi:hypothetical protein